MLLLYILRISIFLKIFVDNVYLDKQEQNLIILWINIRNDCPFLVLWIYIYNAYCLLIFYVQIL